MSDMYFAAINSTLAGQLLITNDDGVTMSVAGMTVAGPGKKDWGMGYISLAIMPDANAPMVIDENQSATEINGSASPEEFLYALARLLGRRLEEVEPEEGQSGGCGMCMVKGVHSTPCSCTCHNIG
jgi:hypothetical protein